MPAPERSRARVIPLSASALTAGAEGLPAFFQRVRDRSLALTAPLSEEDCCVQAMPDASPTKWHLAHTTWFFETFILERYEQDFEPFHDAFRVMFNSYYNGVGDKHPRAQRGLLTRPPLATVHDYRKNIDERIGRLLAARGDDESLRALVTLGLNHEQQHQELILTDVKYLLSMSPLQPAYQLASSTPARQSHALTWHRFDAGLVNTGAEGGAFCFDNELPRHRVFLESFQLASRLVTNGEFLAFVEQGGYRDPAVWLSEGWDWVRANQLSHPLYWSQDGNGWKEFTLAGAMALDPDLPAVHLSYFEAEAFARWSDARLPSEFEWEHASALAVAPGAFAESGAFHPSRAAFTAGQQGIAQMFGDAWEWTRSSYAPYPGYRQSAGAIGEYNGKFMVNQYVLRGGSCATPADHIRASYRNFFPTGARWQFSGVRLARD